MRTAPTLLECAYKEVFVVSNVAVGSDGAILRSAAVAIDVAMESLMPGHPPISTGGKRTAARHLSSRTRIRAKREHRQRLEAGAADTADALKALPAQRHYPRATPAASVDITISIVISY